MSALHIGTPAILILLLLLPFAWWALQRGRRRRDAQLETFGDESLLARSSTLPVARRRVAGQALHLGALALGVVALARPQLGDRPAALAHTGRDLLVLLDLSRSMNAAAGVEAENRLTLAKRAVAAVLATSPGDRVGLIVFGGSAFLQLPLTSNHSAFQRFLSAASTDDLGDPATSLPSALKAASTTFEHDGERGYQSVLLVSDGENGADDMGPSLTRLRQAGIPVFAIGVGTPEGAPVPADSAEAPEKWHRDHLGRIVVSRLEESELRRAARETGGTYVRWSESAAQGIGNPLSLMEKRTISSREATERVDRFQWPLGLAIAALVFEPILGWGSVLLVLAIGCTPAAREIRRGQQLYDAGRYRESNAAFTRALANSGDPALQYAVGTTLYRLHRYEEAARSFREATSVPRLKQRSWYNLGNAYVRAAEEASDKEVHLGQAVAAYEEALRLDPADSAAKWNLELALRRRGEDRESGGSPGRGRSADYGRGNQKTPGYEGNPEAAVGAMAGGGYGSGEGESAEELSESQARQLLEAVEREQLSSHQGKAAMGGGSGEKDW